MAKTGVNFERCNVQNSAKHNMRDPGYIKAVNASPNKKYDIFNDRSKMNVSWVHPWYIGKSLPQLLDEMRSIYRKHVGQAPQENDRVRQVTDKKTGMKREVVTHGWAPIREGVCPIKEDTQIKDFSPFVSWLAMKGPRVIGIYLHHDEGHTDLVTGERKYNHHAHIIVDWLDHHTGKTFKLSKIDASEMQTQIALSLGMERGESKVKTGADHLSPDEYRAKAVANEVIRLTELRNEVTDGLRDNCTALQEVGRNTVTDFDEIVRNGVIQPTQNEKNNRDLLEKEVSESIKALELEKLRQKTTTLRTLVKANQAAIKRYGDKLQELAAKIPSAGFHIFASSAQKAQIMAIEAEKKEAVEQAQAAMNEAEKRNTAALTRERAAKAEKKKYDDLNEKLEQKIKESRNTGYQDGYQKGEAKEKANTLAKQKELDDLKASHASEIDKLNQTLKNEKTLKEFFRETNPYLANAEQNLKELNELQEWSFSDKEINKLFSGGAVEKKFWTIEGEELMVELPVRIELKESNLGNMKVWFNKTTKGNCLKQLEKQAEGRYREYCDSKKIEENTFPVSGPIQAGSDASEEEDTLVGENERKGYEIKI